MSEYSKEPIYYFQMPKGFFKDHAVMILEGMPNGHDYCLLFIKLMCESLPWGGYLRFSEKLPYTPEMMASVTGMNVDVVRGGVEALIGLGLAERMPNGTLFFPWVATLTKSTTKGAEIRAIQRASGGQAGDNGATNVAHSLRVLESKSSNTYDKLDRPDKAIPPEVGGLARGLIERKFITADDLDLWEYDSLLKRMQAEASDKDLMRVIGYVIDRYDPKRVEGKYPWFAKAVESGLARLKKARGITVIERPDEPISDAEFDDLMKNLLSAPKDEVIDDG